ncbi:LysR family transcriptional regulator [Ottowia thiooxydans]|uniref:DNA-binding transcriptional LysR family regulator n=1 Tax=Ottowia thiooxydans TaxID=219182 RepID=A0ABV2QC30_9BURK
MKNVHIEGKAVPDDERIVSRLKMRHLSAVLAIARAGSLQKASQELALSQSAVSKTLTEAEELVGLKLFERSANGVRPTLVGEVIIRYSANVTANTKQASDEFRALLRGESGKLTVGIFTPVAWWDALSACIYDFQKLAPMARLTIRQGGIEDLMASLRDNELDIVLGRWNEERPPGNISVIPLLDDGGPRFVTRADHPLIGGPVSLEQLMAFPWFLPEPPNILLTALEATLEAAGLSLPNRVIYSHAYTINLAVCERTDMISILPAYVLPRIRTLYGLRPLEIDLPLKTVPLSAFVNADKPMEPTTKKFLDRLKEISSGP